MRLERPAGTVTFLFTDVEGSTKLLNELGAEGYAQALAEHRRILRATVNRHGGVEVDTQGDAFFVAFPTAPGAIAAASEAQRELAIPVRMGIHTGTPHLAEEGYVGVDVNRAARIAACGHGGQVLVSASTASLIGSDRLRDLGQHRLKDLSAPERIHQLGDGVFPPLRSLYQTNLPFPTTPFVGRERELQEIGELLEREDVRLLTLTGPGGTGKTRLALQAAGAAADGFSAGVWWVPLAPLRDPALVLETAAGALGAKDDLAEHIGDKRLLLLFDNFEHVIDAAAGVSELLGHCPNVYVLLTSRQLLAVPGEQAYPVPPLEPEEGTELFVARARSVKPDFQPNGSVTELCDRLDNLPLAIELAAARVRMLSPEKLLERLASRLDLLKAGRGVHPRQQTLRATIEWSYEVLTTEEQQLFAELSVFRGCTLEAVERVCEADLETLQSLVDKSLVRARDGGRFWMLETIREYASERLEDSGAAEELRRRHAEHFLALAEEAEPHFFSDRAYEWYDRLEPDHDNFRAALDHFNETGEGQLELRLAGALMRFWNARSYAAEGRRRLEAALRADTRATATRGKALNSAAGLALNVGDSDAGKGWAEEALALHRRLGDPWATARSAYFLGHAAVDEGDFKRGQQLFAESASAFDEFGDDRNALQSRGALAWTYALLGDHDRARMIDEENLRRAREIRDRWLEARSLGGLAKYAREEGRVGDAISFAKESLRALREIGDRTDTTPLELLGIAYSLALRGDAKLAARLIARADGMLEEMGVTWRPLFAQRKHEAITAIRAQLDDAAFAEEWERGRALTLDEAVALALDS